MRYYHDCCIAETFSEFPGVADGYFERLSASGWSQSISQEQLPPFFPTGPDEQEFLRLPVSFFERLLFDCPSSPDGIILRQRLSPSGDPENGKRNLKDPLNLPIFFLRNNPVAIGLSLDVAKQGGCGVLEGADGPAPVGNCTTLTLRTNVLGYEEESHQIRTRQRLLADPITLKRFVSRVADGVDAFLNGARRKPQEKQQIDITAIKKENITLLGVFQVSKGSWQPILRLD